MSARVLMTSEQKSKKNINKKDSELEAQVEELLNIEKKDEFLFEHKTEGIAIIQDRLLKYVNKRLSAMTGYKIEELTGSPFGLYIHPDELPKVVNLYLQRKTSGDVQSKCESVIRNHIGKKIFVEIVAIKITYHEKPADLVLIRDITELKKSLDTAEK